MGRLICPIDRDAYRPDGLQCRMPRDRIGPRKIGPWNGTTGVIRGLTKIMLALREGRWPMSD